MSDTATALAALSGGGKRVKIHDAQTVIKLPKAVKALVNAEADRLGESEAHVHRLALAEYFERRGFGA